MTEIPMTETKTVYGIPIRIEKYEIDLIREATELMNIFGAILRKSE